MLKAKLATIVAAPKNLSQKALNTVVKTVDTVKTNTTTFVEARVNDVLHAGETAAWKVADALHDKQIRPTS